MARIDESRRAVPVSISLRRHQIAGAQQIAMEDGHDEFSRVFQDLIESELRRRYGRDWSNEIGTNGVGEREAVAV